MRLRERIVQAFRECADSIMLEQLAGSRGNGACYTYRQVSLAVGSLQAQLIADQRADGKPLRVGVVMENGPTWVVTDLALFLDSAIEVPIPLGFSVAQANSLLETIDLCLVDERGAECLVAWYGEVPPFPVHTIDLEALLERGLPIAQRLRSAEDDICKIIHTSGTTSHPKGVMVRESGLDVMISSLLACGKAGSHARYLSSVPFSILTEQIAAIYVVVAQGGTIIFLPLGVPLSGAEGVTPSTMFPYIRAAKATALTLRPAFVEAIADAYAQGHSPEVVTEELFGTLQPPFLACGGAPVAQATLERMATYGVMIYEGYGLSENCTVVSWNNPSEWKFGTVGKPLAHVTLKIASDGELLIQSASMFAGYTRTDASSCVFDEDGWLHTGDLASIDEEGYLRIIGRKKNLIITADGLVNISPEWLETAYMTLDFVEEAVVLGDGLDVLHGIFVISNRYPKEEAVKRLRSFGEATLDAGERVAQITVLPSNQETYDKYFTVSGKPRRERLLEDFVVALSTPLIMSVGSCENDRAS